MHIQSFDSIEEMQAVMQTAEEEANAGLLPEQIALRDATDKTAYWVRPLPEADCLVFGRAFGFTELCESSAKYVAPKDDEEHEESLEEAVWEIRQSVESRQRGYLFGEAFSIMEERGELGSTHVANAFPISERAFAEAQAHGWRAIEADPLARMMMPEDELEKRTTPTLAAELRAFSTRLREMKR